MSRRLFICNMLNLLAVIIGLGLGIYAYMLARQYFARDIIYISPAIRDSHWTADEVTALKEQFPELSITPAGRGREYIISFVQQSFTTVIYTHESYFSKHSLEFLEGGPFHYNGIVLSHVLAWRLFGIENVAGLVVTINNKPYIVSGIVRNDVCTAWMLQKAAPVTALYVQLSTYNHANAVAIPRQILGAGDRYVQDYTIVDINRYVEAMAVRFQLLAMLMALCMLIVTVRVVLRRLSAHAAPALKPPPACVNHCVNRKSRKYLPKGIILHITLPALWALVCLCIILVGVWNIIYWLPFGGTGFVQAITNAGILPSWDLSFGLVRLYELNRLGNIAWIIGVVGFFNFMLCGGFVTMGRSPCHKPL